MECFLNVHHHTKCILGEAIINILELCYIKNIGLTLIHTGVTFYLLLLFLSLRNELVFEEIS
jgi:hypothetical protein